MFLHQCAHWCRPFDSVGIDKKKSLLRKQKAFLFGELRNLGYKYYALIRRQFHGG